MDYTQSHSYYSRLMWVGLAIFVISALNLLGYYNSVFVVVSLTPEQINQFIGINSALLMVGLFTVALMQACHDQVTIRKLAFHDELTGLINRRRFNEIFEGELENCRKNDILLGVLALDLDRFKVINDCHGHDAGDKIIQQFAHRISASIRDHDVLCRMSGDEFCLLANDVTSENDILMIGNRILEAMKKPFIYKGKHIYAGVSLGAVIIENGWEDTDFALRMADFALLRSKELGRSQLVLFDPEMEAKVKRKADLEIKLREALATDKLSLRYQPMIDHDTGTIRGVEALVRWIHPELGKIQPSEFIPLAGELALMDKIGDFVLKRACQEISKYENMRLAVNITSTQFLQESFVDTVAHTLLETKFTPSKLELEIKQNLLSNHTEVAKSKIQSLRELGVRIALDDFGTGISSMKHIRDFELDRVKLDRSFTKAIETRNVDDDFLPNMIGMAASLGTHVTVEGVETAEQAKLLTELGCNELQGFYFSKPLTTDELIDYDLRTRAKISDPANDDVAIQLVS